MKIKTLSDTLNYEITPENFENILNVYKDKDDFYFFNLLNTIHFPADLDVNTYDIYIAKPDDWYTIISYRFYKTIKLWWVICGMNNIIDPTYPPYVGRQLKILKPFYLHQVLSTIQSSE